jgi:two-component system sensor histidine kinase TctE
MMRLSHFIHPHSLKYQLFSWILIFILPLILISTSISYLLTRHFINQTYDKSLYRTALALANQISLDDLSVKINLPQVAKELLEFDEVDDIYFRIIGPQGDLVSTHTDLPLPKKYPSEDQFLYYDTELESESLRVVIYALPDIPNVTNSQQKNAIYVMVGETRQKRSVMTNEIIFSMLLPQILIILLLSALIYLGIQRGLNSLALLKQDLNQRDTNDLSPMDRTQQPTELHPLLDAFNDLLQRIKESNAQQQRFVADAAHQLKTPLAGLKTQAELALRETDTHQVAHTLSQINHATSNLSRLVNQLLSLTKAELDGITFAAFEPTNLLELARDVAQDWVNFALRKHIDYGFETANMPTSDNALVLGNAVLLRELMHNLIDNAIRYTAEGGNVTVGVKQEDAHLIFYVQDNGIGISIEDQALIFERFYRVLGSKQEGSGLGLTIVKEIADRHHARVALHSSENSGALFEVIFNQHLLPHPST